MYRINLSQYSQPIQSYGPVDLGASFRALAAQNLQQQQMAEQQREYNTTNERLQKEHADNIQQQRQVLHDTNARFATEQSNAIQLQRHNESANKRQQLQKTLDTARQLVVAGKWNEAMGLMGTLRDMGANVNVTTGPDGKPIFDMSAPEDSTPELSGDFNSIMNNISGQQEARRSLDAKNPYETQLNTLQSSVSPETQQQYGYSDQTVDDINRLNSNINNSSPSSASPNPLSLDTSQLSNWTAMRLNPVLSGLVGAVPHGWQNNMQNLTEGFKSLGMPPEATLETMQKPYETTASLWRAQDASQGAMARASMSQGGAASSEDRLRENEAFKRTATIGKKYGLDDAIKSNAQYDEIRSKVNSGIPQAQADAVKQLIALREGNRITDQDFAIALRGIASNIEEAKIAFQRIVVSGLLPSQLSNFNGWLDIMKDANRKRIKTAVDQTKRYAGSFRYEPERYAVKNYIMGTVPEDMLPADFIDWDPLAQQGGDQTRGGAGKKRSVSVSAPTAEQAGQVVKDINSEADEFLR